MMYFQIHVCICFLYHKCLKVHGGPKGLTERHVAKNLMPSSGIKKIDPVF